MSPNETLFLESTNKIVKDDINNSSFVQFQIWDFPGQIDFFDSTFDYDMIFGGCGALIFVIDAQVKHFIITVFININPYTYLERLHRSTEQTQFNSYKSLQNKSLYKIRSFHTQSRWVRGRF